MTDFLAMKSEIASSTNQQLWDIIRRTILATEEACVRYVYARTELNKRGLLVG